MIKSKTKTPSRPCSFLGNLPQKMMQNLPFWAVWVLSMVKGAKRHNFERFWVRKCSWARRGFIYEYHRFRWCFLHHLNIQNRLGASAEATFFEIFESVFEKKIFFKKSQNHRFCYRKSFTLENHGKICFWKSGLSYHPEIWSHTMRLRSKESLNNQESHPLHD